MFAYYVYAESSLVTPDKFLIFDCETGGGYAMVLVLSKNNTWMVLLFIA